MAAYANNFAFNEKCRFKKLEDLDAETMNDFDDVYVIQGIVHDEVWHYVVCFTGREGWEETYSCLTHDDLSNHELLRNHTVLQHEVYVWSIRFNRACHRDCYEEGVEKVWCCIVFHPLY